jgi:hypothetical protein|tara:strand:- start:165 stop:431 length:267 start_codon:yes stop_codon:yes gene_type:complete
MKYVYVKNRNTLDVARHEIIIGEFGFCYPAIPSEFETLSYHEYRAIVNGKLQAQLEILDQENTNRQRAYDATKKELCAKRLPMDEVTE